MSRVTNYTTKLMDIFMRYTIFDKLSLDIVKTKYFDIQIDRLKKQTIFGHLKIEYWTKSKKTEK